MRSVRIRWTDSTSFVGWTDMDDIDLAPMEITSLGFMFREEDSWVAISTSHAPNDTVSDPLVIPRAAIVSIEDV